MPERITYHQRSGVFTDLEQLEYNRALSFQLQTVQKKIAEPRLDDQILFVEHPPVFTLGKRGGEENLSVSKDFLKSRGIDVVQTNRGGNITYHGPGQAVLYPIVDLEKNKIGVKEFVVGLEEVMKLTAMDYGIHADRNEKNHGIWVGDSKIGSVGISIKKGISFHGLALNINPDLDPFSWINPCGLRNVSITSIEKEVYHQGEKNNPAASGDAESPIRVSMDRIKNAFITHFSSVFNFKIKKTVNEN